VNAKGGEKIESRAVGRGRSTRAGVALMILGVIEKVAFYARRQGRENEAAP